MYKYQIELDQLSITTEKLEPLLSDPLSNREFEILQDIIKGLDNDQISETRYISINTTKFHVSNVFRKMNVSNRAALLHKILTLFT